MRITASLFAVLLATAPALGAEAVTMPEKPFQLMRMARAAQPGLHIRVVDPAGALAYPVPVAVEYDTGAPVQVQANKEGLTVPADGTRTVKAVTLGDVVPQRFDIDSSRGNFLVFSR